MGDFEVITQFLPDIPHIGVSVQQVSSGITQARDLVVVDDVVTAGFTEFMVDQLVEVIKTHIAYSTAGSARIHRCPLSILAV